MGRFSDQIEQDPSQGDTYVWRASVIRRREYPEEGNDDDYRRLHWDQKPPDRGGHSNGGGRPPDTDRGPPKGGYLNRGGRPLIEEDTLVEVGDPLIEEDTLVEDSLIERWTP